MLMNVQMEKTVPASSAALTTAVQVPGVKTGCTCEFPRSILIHEYSFLLLLAFSIWFIGQVIYIYKTGTLKDNRSVSYTKFPRD